MGKEKGGFLTPKAIANRIKAKGLQKLRWYCQMCQKQCRDENGFKCHLTSESHQRQLLLFADNPDEYIDGFSKEFFDDFTELLRRRFGTKRVHANIVYQEYIANKEHMHMNSTQWETLTEFVKWLGREGHCVVDETEKGWFITYIDRDWEAIKKQEDLQKKDKMEMDDEERTARLIQKQIERAQASAKHREVSEATELKREKEDEKVAFNFGGKIEEKASTSKILPTKSNPLSQSKLSAPVSSTSATNSASKTPKVGEKRKSALDEIMELEERNKEKINRKDYWLHKDIVVKVVTRKLGNKMYGLKGVITEVVNLYTAVIKLLECGTKLKVDQKHLETVIPAIGREVKIVNGAYRGYDATLLEVKEKKFCCTVRIGSGPLQGRVIEGMQYEDVSKLYKSS